MEPVIEGPARKRDLSYHYLLKFEPLLEVEKGIPMSQFFPYMKIRDLDLEFRLLKKITETKDHAQVLCENSPETMAENRYPDVLPYRDTIVSLHSGKYINADFVDGPMSDTEDLFIVTQGPLACTVTKFWEMVWEFNVSLVVMSCLLYESDQEKCDLYFPMEGIKQAGPYIIELVRVKETHSGLIQRRFIVRQEESDLEHIVDHIQVTNWPDHASPDLETDSESLQYLLNYMKKRAKPMQKIVVHCSAGCGRSGAIVGLYCMITALEALVNDHQPCPRVSVFGTVRRLREQRWGLVQTKEQYSFLYHFMEYWISNYLAQRLSEEEEEEKFTFLE